MCILLLPLQEKTPPADKVDAPLPLPALPATETLLDAPSQGSGLGTEALQYAEFTLEDLGYPKGWSKKVGNGRECLTDADPRPRVDPSHQMQVR